MPKAIHLFWFFILVLPQVWLSSCDPNQEFQTGNDINLEFSVDTLQFDTVFTERGSATRSFKVYNRSDEAIQIDRISVDGMTGVTYTFNVDGNLGPEVTDQIIWAEDSIWVFVEVEVDPTAPTDVSPFIAEDLIRFETGERSNTVVLQAMGQNANYLLGINNQESRLLSCENGTLQLDNSLPIVIYGQLFVDSCALEIIAGSRIYIHGGITRNDNFGIFNDGFIFTLPNGSLRFLGTPEDPIIVQSDRLEAAFDEEVGQYRGIFLGPQSTGNIVRHTQLLHGIEGLNIDSLAEVDIESSIIAYTAGSALIGRNATVTARNSLFHSNFANTIQFIQGVRLDMDHCTVASYGVDASSIALQNFQCFDADCNQAAVVPVQLNVRNSILAGSRSDEIIFIDGFNRADPTLFRVDIQNSVVRVSDNFTGEDSDWTDFFDNLCTGCYNLQSGDPLFESIAMDDYQLDSLSVALDLGELIPGLEQDIEGNERMSPVAAGAFVE
ncbi:MAG: hypothetical protein AAF433_16790 [Bacteroidota bacterium]